MVRRSPAPRCRCACSQDCDDDEATQEKKPLETALDGVIGEAKRFTLNNNVQGLANTRAEFDHLLHNKEARRAKIAMLSKVGQDGKAAEKMLEDAASTIITTLGPLSVIVKEVQSIKNEAEAVLRELVAACQAKLEAERAAKVELDKTKEEMGKKLSLIHI